VREQRRGEKAENAQSERHREQGDDLRGFPLAGRVREDAGLVTTMPEAGTRGVVRAFTVEADFSKSSMTASVTSSSLSPEAIRLPISSSSASSGGIFCPRRSAWR
jgi:hypothetical protein